MLPWLRIRSYREYRFLNEPERSRQGWWEQRKQRMTVLAVMMGSMVVTILSVTLGSVVWTTSWPLGLALHLVAFASMGLFVHTVWRRLWLDAIEPMLRWKRGRAHGAR